MTPAQHRYLLHIQKQHPHTLYPHAPPLSQHLLPLLLSFPCHPSVREPPIGLFQSYIIHVRWGDLLAFCAGDCCLSLKIEHVHLDIFYKAGVRTLVWRKSYTFSSDMIINWYCWKFDWKQASNCPYFFGIENVYDYLLRRFLKLQLCMQ